MDSDDVAIYSTRDPAGHRKDFGERDLRNWKIPVSKCSCCILLIDKELKKTKDESAPKKSNNETHDIGDFWDFLRKRRRCQDDTENSDDGKAEKGAQHSPRRDGATSLDNAKPILLAQCGSQSSRSIGL